MLKNDSHIMIAYCCKSDKTHSLPTLTEEKFVKVFFIKAIDVYIHFSFLSNLIHFYFFNKLPLKVNGLKFGTSPTLKALCENAKPIYINAAFDSRKLYCNVARLEGYVHILAIVMCGWPALLLL